jgi:hypothetical protein
MTHLLLWELALLVVVLIVGGLWSAAPRLRGRLRRRRR